jgi:hypothetical protein
LFFGHGWKVGGGKAMDRAREFRFVVSKAYTIPGKGVVVTGRVEKGAIAVGDEAGFLGTDGQMTRATVTAIEVSRRLVEETQAGQEASLLLEGARKNQITPGTVLMEAPEAPPVPVGPAPVPAQTVRYDRAAPPPPPTSGSPIEPSSGWGRFVIFFLIGVIVLLFLLFSQGMLDREKLDPRKWDPRKKLTSVQQSATSFQPSEISFQPSLYSGVIFGEAGYKPAPTV